MSYISIGNKTTEEWNDILGVNDTFSGLSDTQKSQYINSVIRDLTKISTLNNRGDYKADNSMYSSLRLGIGKLINPMQIATGIGNILPPHFYGTAHISIPMQSISATAYSPLINSYSETNYNSLDTIAIYSTSMRGMAFTGNGASLVSCKFYLNKVNSPVGNVQAELYAHTGTFSTSGKPTGSVLATSTTADVTKFSSNPSIALVTFVFPTPYTCVAGTHYVVVIHKVSGFDNSSNWVGVGANHTSHAGTVGNESEYSSSWSADGTWALCFYAYSSMWGVSTSALTVPMQTISVTGHYSTSATSYHGTSAISNPMLTVSATGHYTSPATSYHGSSAITIPMQTISSQGSYVH